MKSASSSLSPELLKANQRLYELRQQRKSHQAEPHQTVLQRPLPDTPPWEESESNEKCLTAVEPITKLPQHLGWGSEAVTKKIRIAIRRCQRATTNDERLTADDFQFHPETDGCRRTDESVDSQSKKIAENPPSLPLYKDSIKHYPSIGIAVLKKEQAAIYRVWLMCRYLDHKGRGWLAAQDFRELLTNKKSKLRLFGWRRLRQILGQGHGRFWKWDKANGRVWLFGAARVAANLGVSRLSGKPVLLPVTTVTNKIGEFKAHLYGAWHSGRKTNNPISREVQKNITGVPERTQRHYCQIARIRCQTNIAIGRKYSEEEIQKQAWRRGRAIFKFTDHRGRLGQKDNKYIAWHLPNTYISPHHQTSNGRMRKINQKLRDLVKKGKQGNGREKVVKKYLANGAEAVRALNKGKGSEFYWPMVTVTRSSNLWTEFSLP